ncbi:cytochrome P450 [Nocardia nova SH22a]|uniref:Cytochrome P450 n=1 Tax=Nocardia nova SH22a TaxID=1415166 RepID=W5TT81_9NOCA|nr:cytochrome P450 [Nocardia nova]AHH22133.1 cytochrome P450 [Nocardia nova SH22a]
MTIPTAPGALPVLGHIPQLLRRPLGFLTTLPEYGDLVRVWLGRVPAVVVCDADLTHRVLRDDRTFDKGGPLFDRAREVSANGIVTCPHDQHRRQRRLCQPSFHTARLENYASVMTTRIAEVTGSWQDGEILDVPDQMRTLTNRIAVETLFSDELSPRTREQALDDLSVIATGTYPRMLTPRSLDWLPTPANRRYRKARIRLRRTLDGIIADRRAHDDLDYGDLLSTLLSARDARDDDRGLIDAEIYDQVLSFFGAGSETTAANLTMALHLLAGHPGIEQRLRSEVDATLTGKTATYADLPGLTLTSRVINETMRLWPAGWILTRTTTIDTELGAHHITAGTNIIYSPYLIHRLPDLYPAPHTFDPDRWDPERPQPPRSAFIPFGGGARKCIGDQFGLIENTLALATIVARWQLRSLPGQSTHLVRGATLSVRPLRMQATARP